MIDTHLAAGESAFEESLSELVDVDGLQGRWFREGDGHLSSWGNDLAFWPTPESLGRMLHDAGYDVVLEVDPWVMSDRRFFVALPATYTSPVMGVRRQVPALVRSLRFRASRQWRAARATEL